MSSLPVPKHTTVLVVGGGPSGSYAASVLARRNIDVTVLEGAKFPRYHVGETLLASCNYFLEYIGAREKIVEHGFIRKPGGAFKLRADFPETYTNFVDCQTGNRAFNVVRSEYDDILFRHAGSQGAKIFDEHKVTSLKFSELDPKRPVSAAWESKSGDKGIITFDYIIDASGRQGLFATKYNKDRKMSQCLKNTAIWAYWEGGNLYGAGTEKEGAALTEALHDNTGWCWYIPVSEGVFSIGFVMHEEYMKAKKSGKTSEQLYLEQFEHVELTNQLRGDAVMLPNEGKSSPIHQASDYSYSADDMGQLNYRLCGDSAAFIDPFFASGVHLAFVGALSAALSLISVIEGKENERDSAEFHNAQLKSAFTRFFAVVVAGYKQLRGGKMKNILNNIDETSYDRAFGFMRPVIQGTGDVGVDRMSKGDTKRSQEELVSSMDFVGRLLLHAPEVDHDLTDGEPKNEKLGDLDGEARTRLETLGGNLACIMGNDGVKQILDQAQERMRAAVLKGGANLIAGTA